MTDTIKTEGVLGSVEITSGPTWTAEATPIKDDPRVMEMAKCLAFVVRMLPDRTVVDMTTYQPKGLHEWILASLKAAGYDVSDMENPPAPKAKKRRGRR